MTIEDLENTPDNIMWIFISSTLIFLDYIYTIEHPNKHPGDFIKSVETSLIELNLNQVQLLKLALRHLAQHCPNMSLLQDSNEFEKEMESLIAKSLRSKMH